MLVYNLSVLVCCCSFELVFGVFFKKYRDQIFKEHIAIFVFNLVALAVKFLICFHSQSVCSFFWNVFRWLESGILSFNDNTSIPEYATEAVNILNKNSILNGDNNNNLRPNDFANRAEAAVMLHRFINLIKGEGGK